MDESIGEKLRQARKKKGITLEQAAEVTKIRKDFLISFEEENFDISLPGIYKIGFLKIYAKHLGLDVNEILEQYFKISPKEKDSSFSYRNFLEQISHQNRSSAEDNENFDDSAKYVRPLPFVYFKKILIILGLFLLLFLGTVLFKLYYGSNSEEVVASVASRAEKKEEKAISETITLRALGDVRVFVRRIRDNKRLFRGILSKGESANFEKTEAVKISYSNGKNLIIEHGNKQIPHSNELNVVTLR